MPLTVAPLFVPGHMRRLREKVVELDVGCVVVDLEDAVPGREKEAARAGAIELIRNLPSGRCIVRINPLTSTRRFTTGCGHEDLAAIVIPGVAGLLAPKVESADGLRAIDRAITSAERAASLPPNSLVLGVTIETALGLVNAVEIARVELGRPMWLACGLGDLTTDLGIPWERDEGNVVLPRSLIPIASRAAGLKAPMDSVFVHVGDEAGLRESTLRGKRLGYGGKLAIHPSQLGVIVECYRPSPDDVAWSRKVVRVAAEREATGEGAFLLDGKMIDAPIVERARELVELSERFN